MQNLLIKGWVAALVCLHLGGETAVIAGAGYEGIQALGGLIMCLAPMVLWKKVVGRCLAGGADMAGYGRSVIYRNAAWISWLTDQELQTLGVLSCGAVIGTLLEPAVQRAFGIA